MYLPFLIFGYFLGAMLEIVPAVLGSELGSIEIGAIFLVLCFCEIQAIDYIWLTNIVSEDDLNMYRGQQSSGKKIRSAKSGHFLPSNCELGDIHKDVKCKYDTYSFMSLRLII